MYQLTNSPSVIRLKDGAVIPPANTNADWIAYQEWLSYGNNPLPAPTPIPATQL